LFALLAGLAHADGSQAGFIVTDDDGAGYLYFPTPQPLTQSIFIQRPDAHGNPKCCVKLNRNDLQEINAKAATGEQHIDIMNSMSKEGYEFSAYKIMIKLPFDDSFIGMAIAADKVMAYSSFRISAYTNKKRLIAWVCFGIEGQNLIFREAPEKYHSMYIYFNYDIDEKPKCNVRDGRILGGQ
jgi:hypothetical protein